MGSLGMEGWRDGQRCGKVGSENGEGNAWGRVERSREQTSTGGMFHNAASQGQHVTTCHKEISVLRCIASSVWLEVAVLSCSVLPWFKLPITYLYRLIK